ncbi:glycerophosphodiester phosphodiesterase [Aquisalibacillus elongatus]|uniref:glycerophosphodiester phosphodiesterase n=1 Tax=Aquisalibacillus elongatus TaxID=485577 RepID=UPI001FE2B141|nr:glycerophosphodiester phosphodiesterase [Aquisalibacillus elongatus]
MFAHRGASQYAPENTLPAFELAEQLGADGIELDVQLTKDLIPVIIHDENIRRTTNGTGFVQNYTLDELQEFDAGYWFSKHYIHTPIMSLKEFLQWIQNRDLLINVELKTNVIEYPTIEKRVMDLINEYNVIDRTIISSYNPNTIKRLRDINDDIELALLTNIQLGKVDEVLDDIGANALHFKSRLLSSKMVKLLFDKNIPYRVFTVNRVSTMKKCVTMEADGIFSDVPDIMKKHKP